MSATQTGTKKRKSTSEAALATKKVKTAESASKPAPLKSALKKTVPKDEVAAKKTKASKTSKIKPVKEQAVSKEAATARDSTANAAKKKPAKEKPDEEAVKEAPVKQKSAKKEIASAVTEAVEDAAEPVKDDVEDGGAALTDDQTAALIAGFSSSEDEASGDEEDGVAISKLPQVPSLGDVQKRIQDATEADPERTPGVIYAGRIPHGFYEPQMRAYFSQFGTISNMRLARNRKTGKSQHYAFIEFASKSVAEIVAKTMDKYLLFGHIMQVRTIPKEQVKENMWKGSGRRKKLAPRNRLEGSHLKRAKVREDWEKKIGLEERKRAEQAQKLKEMGYEFEMPELKAVSEVPVKAKKIEDALPVGDGSGPEQLDGNKVVEECVAAPSPVVEAPAVVAEEAHQVAKKRPSTEVKTKKAKKVKT